MVRLLGAELGDTSSIGILSIAGSALFADVNAASCECTLESDRSAMTEMAEACGSTEKFDRHLEEILHAVTTKAAASATATETAVSVQRKQRRLFRTILLTEELGHLARQFEKFVSEHIFAYARQHYCSSWSLLLRRNQDAI